jgi:hypothetical protein
MDTMPLISHCAGLPVSTLLLAGIVLGGALFCVAIAKRVFGLMVAGGALAFCAGLALIITSAMAGRTMPEPIEQIGRSAARTAGESVHDEVQRADRARKALAATTREIGKHANVR